MENNVRYKEQQAALNQIASELGVVASRPDYHGKTRDKNTVLFYTKEDEAHNCKVDLEPSHYTQSEAHDRMKYQKVKIPEQYIWRDPFWSLKTPTPMVCSAMSSPTLGGSTSGLCAGATCWLAISSLPSQGGSESGISRRLAALVL